MTEGTLPTMRPKSFAEHAASRRQSPELRHTELLSTIEKRVAAMRTLYLDLDGESQKRCMHYIREVNRVLAAHKNVTPDPEIIRSLEKLNDDTISLLEQAQRVAKKLRPDFYPLITHPDINHFQA